MFQTLGEIKLLILTSCSRKHFSPIFLMVGTRSTKEATLWLSGSGSLDLNWWPRVSRWCAIYIQLLWCSADNWGNFVCKKGKQRMIGWVVQEALTVAATLALATKVTNTTDSRWICDAPAGLSIRAITWNTCYSWVCLMDLWCHMWTGL